MAREVLEWNLTYLRRTYYIHPVLEGEGGKPTRMKYELSRNPSGNRVCSECRESTADHHPPPPIELHFSAAAAAPPVFLRKQNKGLLAGVVA